MIWRYGIASLSFRNLLPYKGRSFLRTKLCTIRYKIQQEMISEIGYCESIKSVRFFIRQVCDPSSVVRHAGFVDGDTHQEPRSVS